MASTFGTFTMARLGIYAASQGLRVTGNNITNINTEGYTRQTLDQFSLSMGGSDLYQTKVSRVGNGVIAPSVSHERDEYLDIRYRNENTNVGYTDAMLEGLEQLTAMFDEVNKGNDGEGVIEALFNDAIEQMDRLAASGAGDDMDDTLFRSAMSSLVTQLNQTADSLTELQDNMETTLSNDIQEVNDILDRIRVLNDGIRKSEIFDSPSLELEDERNALIDQLSTYMRVDVTYTTEMAGGTTGAVLVDGKPVEVKGTESVAKEVSKIIIKTGTSPQRWLVDGTYVGNLRMRPDTASYTNDNYDLDITDLTNTKGDKVLLRESDTGAIKDRDMGAVLDGAGFAVEYDSKDAAQDAADARNAELEELRRKVARGEELPTSDLDTEYRVVEWEDGKYTVHQYGITEYTSGEEAQNAIEAMIRDVDKHPNELGELTLNSYRVIAKDGHFEVHIYDTWRGECQCGDEEFSGALLADREILTEKGVFSTPEDVERDPDAAGKRGIPFYQEALDVLARSLAEELNAANTIDDEILYRMKGKNFVNENGRVVTGDRSRYVFNEGYEDYKGGALLSNHPGGDDTEGITAANISISQSWSNASVRVLRSRQAAAPSMMNDNLDHIRIILDGSHTYTTGVATEDAPEGEVFYTGSYQGLFTNHIAMTLANDDRTTSSMLDNYELFAQDLYVSRDGVMGVDLNDEAMDMIRYQQSYNAACRLMNAFDDMLDRLINGTAV